eukprot:24530-Eustigmatos_ZCMA.PRE.1
MLDIFTRIDTPAATAEALPSASSPHEAPPILPSPIVTVMSQSASMPLSKNLSASHFDLNVSLSLLRIMSPLMFVKMAP